MSERFLTYLAATLLLTLGILMSVQVFMRYVFSLPFIGIEEVTILLAQWVYFVGAALASSRSAHISGGILSLFPDDHWIISASHWISAAVTAVVLGFSAFYALDYFRFVIDSGKRSPYLSWPFSLWVTAPLLGIVAMLAFEARNALRPGGRP